MTPRERLLQRIEEEEFSNPAFKGAYRKGAIARLDGGTVDENPYDFDNYGPQGVTFSRAFHRHWSKGHADADRFLRRDADE